jgi:hypothetical protein
VSNGILIIAPGSSLNTVADIVAAANGMRVATLHGYVSSREALKEIANGRYQIVHFAGHGCVDSVQVSDGPLGDEYLEMALRSSEVELVLLNTCASVAMAAKLYRAGVAPRVIGWRDDVSDQTAIAWAAAFYAALALGADYWEAYLNSAEIMRARTSDFEPPVFLNGRIAMLEQQVIAIQTEVDDLNRAVVLPRRTLVLALAAAAALILAFHTLVAPHLQVIVR